MTGWSSPAGRSTLAQFALRADRHRVHHLHRARQQPVRRPSQIVFPWPVVGALTIFWFTGMMNTVNWLDGLDGLAAGVSAHRRGVHRDPHDPRGPIQRGAAAAGAAWARRSASCPTTSTRRRLFMGSGGSYFLGWAVAALGIIGGAKVATVLLAMGLPILDVAWLIYNRWRHGGHAGLQRPRPPAPPAARHRLHPAADRAGLLRVLCAVRRAGAAAGEPAVQADCAGGAGPGGACSCWCGPAGSPQGSTINGQHRTGNEQKRR